MFQSIRLRLLGLVLAAVVPFTALIGLGIWDQWRMEQAQALQYALSEARSVAAQVDDHVGNLENLLAGLVQAISTNPADADANDAMLARAMAEQPAYIGNITLFGLDGKVLVMLANGKSEQHTFDLKTAGISPGMYILSLEAGNQILQRRMIIPR